MLPNSKPVYDVSASIVLFHNEIDMIGKVINSFFGVDSLKKKLFLIDNSANDSLKVLASDNENIEYIFNNTNLGFSKGHNIILNQCVDISKYHIVLNPDITFDSSILDEIFHYMESNEDVGQLMPLVTYPTGQTQYLCKLLPRPIDLILRFIWPFETKSNSKFELRSFGYNKIANIPYLSGCFMFLRTSVINETGGFDEKIFMYLEDGDLTRRIHRRYKTIFYPEVSVVHEHNKESFRSLKLMLIHIKSVIYYFNKYGWFWDKERKTINKKVIKSLD